MLRVSPCGEEEREFFAKLFNAYYKELGCDEDCAQLIKEYILPDFEAGLLKIGLLKDGGAVAGFVIYQVDDIDNDWCVKEGWGDIREIYIVPAFRKKGYGKLLLASAEEKLKEGGADNIYALPCESAESFFTACGYNKTEEYFDELDCSVFEK